MKRKMGFTAICLFIIIGILDSCVSLQDRVMTQQERQEAEILGSVSVEWTATHFFHIRGDVKNKAYTELKKAAQQKYPGNIDIVNISVAGSFSGWNILWGLFYFASPILLDVQKITASGDVISYSAAAQTASVTRSKTQGSTTGIEGAINRAIGSLINDLPSNKSIAVLSVSSRDREAATFVIDELEFQLVDSRQFKVVDRKTLDAVRSEQNFQLSGDVDDNSAVSIGKMLGADIVITGSISGTGTIQRLTIKALDVQTAQILTMAREQF
jgi:TolB-like protein